MDRKTVKQLREEAAGLGARKKGNKAVLRRRVENYKNKNLNASLVKTPAVVLPLDDTPFLELPPYKEVDDELRNSLIGWMNVTILYNYFQIRMAINSYKKGRWLHKSRFLKNVSYTQVTNKIHQVRAYCSPAMKKQTTYHVKIEVCSERCNITKSNCSCVAGLGLSAACKHVAALLCCIEDFVTTGTAVQHTSCTNALQVWHRPPKNTPKEHMYEPVDEMIQRRALKRKTEVQDIAEKPPTRPVVDITDFFVNYTISKALKINANENRRANLVGLANDHDYLEKTLYEDALERINFIDEEKRRLIEAETVKQNQSKRWYQERRSRITASRIKEVITAVETGARKGGAISTAIATSNFESRDLSKIPQIAWGQENEEKAFNLFVSSYTGKKVFRKCGLFVDRNIHYLAASPDGICCCQTEVIEIKCPYIDRDNFAVNSHFLQNGELPPTHKYYYQVQFQMHICNASVCHFVVYTKKGIHHTIIHYDKEFIENCLSKLEVFYKHVLCVEYVKRFGF